MEGEPEGERPPADWSVLDLPGVEQVVTKVAGRIGNDGIPLLSRHDLEHEAFIILATRASEVRRRYESGGLGHLGAWLRRRLLDSVRPEIRRAGRQVAYDPTHHASGPVRPRQAADQGKGYSRDDVAWLLPTIWDRAAAYGVAQQYPADPDVPRSGGRKGKRKVSRGPVSDNLFAQLVDVKEAWRTTDLTERQRRAVFMHRVLFWTQEEIACHEGVSQQTISARVDVALDKMVWRLSGLDVSAGSKCRNEIVTHGDAVFPRPRTEVLVRA